MTFATTAEGEKEKLISGGHVSGGVLEKWVCARGREADAF